MPMNKSLYPEDWGAIALSIKQAANWTCQECGRKCRRSGEDSLAFMLRQGRHWREWKGDKIQRYTLTVAHLDHNPGNNSPENLKALCTVCHLRYDNPHHLITRQANRYKRREAAGQLILTFPTRGGVGR